MTGSPRSRKIKLAFETTSLRIPLGDIEMLRAMTPAGHEAVIHVTLTDDHPWAQAFVVIEARPIASR